MKSQVSVFFDAANFLFLSFVFEHVSLPKPSEQSDSENQIIVLVYLQQDIS